ncbi:MAG: patatin-like phospholipase family protein [bacterium]
MSDVADSERALVFGGGGVLGFAWTLGALRAVQSECGIDPVRAGLVVGTSAGSMLAGLLGCGVDLGVILRHQQGMPLPADPAIDWNYDTDSGGALPPLPGFVPGSPRLLLEAMLHPKAGSPAVALSGLLPRGRGTLAPIHAVVSAAAEQGLSGQSWPQRPRTWIVGTDYDSGARVVFGRDDVPISLADAVCASCAIPAWYSPMQVAGRSYIDGGTVSNASADVVLPLVVDGTIREVYVLAPMASVEPDHPRTPMARLERVVRKAITRGLQSDVARLTAAGARVTLLTPGLRDLEVMGPNLMNPRRRTAVLRTSLLTTTGELREQRIRSDAASTDKAFNDEAFNDEASTGAASSQATSTAVQSSSDDVWAAATAGAGAPAFTDAGAHMGLPSGVRSEEDPGVGAGAR